MFLHKLHPYVWNQFPYTNVNNVLQQKYVLCTVTPHVIVPKVYTGFHRIWFGFDDI